MPNFEARIYRERERYRVVVEPALGHFSAATLAEARRMARLLVESSVRIVFPSREPSATAGTSEVVQFRLEVRRDTGGAKPVAREAKHGHGPRR